MESDDHREFVMQNYRQLMRVSTESTQLRGLREKFMQFESTLSNIEDDL
jgi:hypothetical protein